MNTIWTNVALYVAWSAKMRADSIASALCAAKSALEDLRCASDISPEASTMAAVIEANIAAMTQRHVTMQREADRLANISNRLDRLAVRT